MKLFVRIAVLSLAFIGLIMIVSSCSKSKESLPDATQDGKNMLACHVNDETFVTYGKPASAANMGLLGGNPDGVVFDFYGDRAGIAGYKDSKSSEIVLSFSDGEGLGTYPLNNLENRLAVYGNGNQSFRTDSLHTGSLTITRFDDNVIAGTFFFDAAGINGELMHITDGRFDIAR